MRGATLVLLFSKCSSKQRLNTQYREKIRRDHRANKLLCCAASGEREPIIPPSGDRFKRLRSPLPIEQVRIRDGILLAAPPCLIQDHKTIRIGEWNGMEQRAVNNAVDGGIRTNPKRERNHRGTREAEIFPKGP